MAKKGEWPEMGEFIVCTIKTVKQNGVYVDLNGYPGKEGFIFIGEIASGWVKNIRSHAREGQRVVAKALKVRRDRKSIELSIKSVSEERRRDALQKWKNETRARQLMRIIGERSGWEDAEIKSTGDALAAAFGNLYAAFEETAIDAEVLEAEGFEGDWTPLFVELAIENIIPPFVEIRAEAEIEVFGAEGIELIREALTKAEACSSKEEEIEIGCFYDGAPIYRIELKAPDWEVAEKAWAAVEDALYDTVPEDEGSVTVSRAN